jgi:hypothetical protein
MAPTELRAEPRVAVDFPGTLTLGDARQAGAAAHSPARS